MNVINKLTLRHMWLNRRRTLVSIVGIVLAVALMTMLPTGLYSLMDFAGRDAMETWGYYHVKVENYLYEENEKVIDTLDVSNYVTINNIGDYQYTEDEEGNVQSEKYNPTGEEKNIMRLMAVPDNFYEMLALSRVEGKYPENDTEIMVQGNSMYLNPGTKVTIEGKTYTVSGIVEGIVMDEEDISSDLAEPQLHNVNIAYTRISESDLKNKDIVSGYFYVDNPGATIEEKAKELMDELEKTKITEFNSEHADSTKILYNYHVLEFYGMSKNLDITAIFNSMLAIVEIVILGVAATVISNGFSISLSERAQYLGMLSSVGATKKQKRSSVYFEGFITGIISIPIGIVTGIGAIVPLFKIIEEPLKRIVDTEKSLNIIINSDTILWAVGFSVATMVLSLHVPAKRASILTPIEAIRMNKDIKISNKVVKPKKVTRKLLGFEGELALKNLKRDNKKYISTAVSMAISMILFLTIYSIMHYTTLEMEAHEDYGNYDMAIYCLDDFTDGSDEYFEKISEKVIETGYLEEYYRYSMLGIGVFSNKSYPREKILNLDYKDYSSEFITCFGEAYDIEGQSIYPTLIVMSEKDLKKYLETVKIDYEKFVSDKDNAILFDEFKESTEFDNGEETCAGHVYNESIKEIEYEIAKINIKEYEDEQGQIQIEYVEADSVNTKLNIFSSEKNLFYMSEESSRVYILITPQKVEEIVKIGMNMFGQCEYYKIFAFNTSENYETRQFIKNEFEKREEIVEECYFEDNALDADAEKDMLFVVSVCIYGIVLIVALICIVNIINTLSTSFALRRKEFAMLKSVGMSAKTFRRMIIYESLFYGIKTLFYGLPISTVLVLMIRYPFAEVQEKDLGIPWGGYIIAITGVFLVIGTTMLYSLGKIKKENIIDCLKNENV